MTEKEHKAYKYLQKIYHISRRVARLQKMRDDLREDMYAIKGMDFSKDRVQSTPENDKLLRLIDRVDKIERETVEEIHDLNESRQEIVHKIELVPNERHRRLLYDRYVLCLKWSEISIGLSNTDEPLDMRWVYRMHRYALKSFYDHCMTTISVC